MNETEYVAEISPDPKWGTLRRIFKFAQLSWYLRGVHADDITVLVVVRDVDEEDLVEEELV